jgi:hypothetical protein
VKCGKLDAIHQMLRRKLKKGELGALGDGPKVVLDEPLVVWDGSRVVIFVGSI